jgi:cysteine desulfurase
MDRIYLDYAATTPMDRRVFEKMTPYFTEHFGNPSSIHFFGQNAETAVDDSRRTIAELFRTTSEGVIFTSGGTESDNLALRGTAFWRRKTKGATKIIISPVEHHAVLTTAEQLRDEFGFELAFVAVDPFGKVDLNDLERKLDENTAIVSIIYANNEIGTINPVKKIAELCHERGVPFHSDAVQAAAHLDFDLVNTPIDMISIGAHKFYGPKGIGALVCRAEPVLYSQITGGKQEGNHRAGTHNVPSIVGMAEALRLTREEIGTRSPALIKMRDALIDQVTKSIEGASFTGDMVERLPNHASFVFDGVDGNQLLVQLDMAGFACSSGSACKIGDPQPSDVLLAVGIAPQRALGSLRVTLGSGTTLEHIEKFTQVLPKLVESNRARRV